MDLQTLIKDAKERFGFEEAGALNVEALEFLPEVRQMCEADRCRSFNRNWSCPPGCGTLEEISERVKPYTRGILVQSIGQLEDEFDVETMMETEHTQKARFAQQWLTSALLQRSHTCHLYIASGMTGLHQVPPLSPDIFYRYRFHHRGHVPA